MQKIVSPRIYGFDILRIATVMAILFFHVWQFTFYQDVISLPPEISWYHNLTGWVGDFFKYGGLFIVALSFFLIGLKKKTNHSMRFFVLIAGLWALQIMTAEQPLDPTTWDWDIYSYLVIAYILVLALPKKAWLRWPLVIASTVLLSLPFELYSSSLKIADSVQFSGWNLMPWLALPVLFHSLGFLWKEKIPNLFAAIKKWEWPVWVFLIVVFFIVTPDYGPFPAGPGFEAYVFKQKPLMFWKHFAVFMFLMRLSLDGRVNELLSRIEGMKQFSNMAWNKHLGVSYFMHFAFLPLGQRLMDVWAEYPRMFDMLWLFIFIAVEVIVRLMFHARGILREKGIKLGK